MPNVQGDKPDMDNRNLRLILSTIYFSVITLSCGKLEICLACAAWVRNSLKDAVGKDEARRIDTSSYMQRWFPVAGIEGNANTRCRLALSTGPIA